MQIAKNRLTFFDLYAIMVTEMKQFNICAIRERISGRDSLLTDGRSQADTGATARMSFPVFQRYDLDKILF